MLQLAIDAAPDENKVLSAHIIQLNYTLREELFATPYLVYMISEREGRDLLHTLNQLEKKAFRVRALSRSRSIPHDMDAQVTELLTLISSTTDKLDMDHSITLQELFDALFLAITYRHRHMLDLFIKTLLDLRSTWSHAISVVSRSPI